MALPDVAAAMLADLEQLPAERLAGRAAIVEAVKSVARCLDTATADRDHHAVVVLVRELTKLHRELRGDDDEDPFDALTRRMSSAVVDTPDA